MNRLEKLILETYASISEEKETKKFSELPDILQKSLEKRYGKAQERDFLSADLTTYFKTSDVNDRTGSVSHEVIKLP